MMRIDIDEELLEEAVHTAAAHRDDAARFHAEREACYRKPAAARETAFRQCFRSWFSRFQLDRALHDAIGERPRISTMVGHAQVSTAKRRRDQGVELFVGDRHHDIQDHERRRLHVRVLATTLASADATLDLLRPELLHVDDMLDSSFGYEPYLPPSRGGQTYDRLLLDRYGALWSASVVGRLARLAQADADAVERARRRLHQFFPQADTGAAAMFNTLLAGARPTHEELVHLAINPRTGSGRADPGSRCSLCGCPTYCFAAAEAAAAVAGLIRQQRPVWTLEQPVCTQCLDLYAARAAS